MGRRSDDGAKTITLLRAEGGKLKVLRPCRCGALRTLTNTRPMSYLRLDGTPVLRPLCRECEKEERASTTDREKRSEFCRCGKKRTEETTASYTRHGKTRLRSECRDCYGEHQAAMYRARTPLRRRYKSRGGKTTPEPQESP